MAELQASWCRSLADIPESAWDQLLAEGASPFYRWRWLRQLEASGSIVPRQGWQSCHLTLQRGEQLIAAAPQVLWVEVMVQGVIAGAGTLYTYSKMVSLLGPSRAAVFPALAPGLAALMAWPVLGHVPGIFETLGLLMVMTGLIVAVTTAVPYLGKKQN